MAEPSSGKALLIPCLIIALGAGWLLNVLDVLPGVDWVWSLGIGLPGLLILALSGIDKVSIVVGPFLIIASLFSVMRQTGRMTVDIEIPVLVVVFGVLLLIAQVSRLKTPAWFIDDTRRPRAPEQD